MGGRRFGRMAGFALIGGLSLLSCSSSSKTRNTPSECTEGSVQSCAGPGQCQGSQLCGADGNFGSCECGAGGAAGAAGSAGTAGSGGTGGSSGAGGVGASGGAGGATGGAGGATGGAGGTGGATTSGKSCETSGPGLTDCGPSAESCCTSLTVSGGTFKRSYDNATYTNPNNPATVSEFLLDKYEITVGRFRKFVEAGQGTQATAPATGSGANPNLSGSGWQAAWDTSLAASTAALQSLVQCNATYLTWTPSVGSNEQRPMNCITWYEAFAFCAWDGGRLSTEAEWNYAAAGGSDQRAYPWGPAAPGANADLAVYGCYYNGSGTCTAVTSIAAVGSVPAGNGKYGQADLAGNIREYALDWYAAYANPCTDCANLTPASDRVIRGGSFTLGASFLLSSSRAVTAPTDRSSNVGARCARNP